MFQRIPNVLTEEQASELAKDVGRREFYEPLIKPLVNIVSQYVEIVISHPAYCRVEFKPNGHDWHKDTGNNNHMQWCTFSASVLLTDPNSFIGGNFHTRNGSYSHYLDMLLYSSDVEHAVDPSDGNRRVLLMFFA
tara:strand:- start:452 stop:856 length:405 start_codon:yes stop_codon:yes gene_type:complete